MKKRKKRMSAERYSYEIKTIDDYFQMVKDIFSEFKSFVVDTNVFLNAVLKAVRDMIPMVVSGKADYNRVFQIIESVNSALRGYIDRQNTLMFKISSASDILSKDVRWKDFIQSIISSEQDIAVQEKYQDLVPSYVVKEKGEKAISEMFGIEILSDEADVKEGSKKDDEKDKA